MFKRKALQYFTEDDLYRFPCNSEGYIVCPSWDYSRIQLFDRSYRFGTGSVFGDSGGGVFRESSYFERMFIRQ